jgi:cytochrome c2
MLLCAAAMVAPRTTAAQAPKSTTQGVYTPAQAIKGKSVFNGACLGCHTTASHMGPAFELRWFGRPLSELYGYLSNLMPKSAPGTLTEDEYVWVTAYILKLNGMPAGKVELTAEPNWLKAVRIDAGPSNAPSPLEDGWEVRRFRLVPQF